jgi:hypothetical protein
VDFDGDGIGDIVSGSWPGELYLFRGEGKGTFAAGVNLRDAAGKVINPGNASTVFAFDWNGNGNLDLLTGNIDGTVQVYLNGQGSAGKGRGWSTFGKPTKLQVKGTDIRVEHGDSHPVAADWDGDGLPDLVVGCGDGSVVWYRNVGTRTEPKLESARRLVAAPPVPGPQGKAKGDGRGTRAKVWVGDWNGDGVLDLLVGDFSMSYGEAPKLTDADKAVQQKAQAALDEAMKALRPYIEEMQKEGNLAAAKTPEERKEREKRMLAVQERYKKELAAMSAAREELQRFQPPYTMDGFVWLYAGERPAAAKSR